MAEVPRKVEEKIVQSSGLNQETITAGYGITLLLNARSQGNSRILLMMSVRRRNQERLT